jgi:hypothetical protein
LGYNPTKLKKEGSDVSLLSTGAYGAMVSRRLTAGAGKIVSIQKKPFKDWRLLMKYPFYKDGRFSMRQLKKESGARLHRFETETVVR